MLAVSSSLNLFQNFEWEFPDHPMGMMIGTTTEDQQNLEGFNLIDSCGVDFLPNIGYPLLRDCEAVGGRGQSQPSSGAGSADDYDHQVGADVLATKRQNHNESERDRRKKINSLYSSLRALLPASDLTKKLSIPSTVGRVLKYIPELQKEVEDLTHKKEELLSLQGDGQSQRETLTSQEESKPRKKPRITKEIIKPSISMEKVEEREIVIHISTSQRITSLPEVLLLLEKVGLAVIDVSSFQSFGGRALYNLHLAMSGTNNVKYGTLKEELSNLIQKHNQAAL